MPASTRPPDNQNATNSGAFPSTISVDAAEHHLVVTARLDVPGILQTEVVLIREEVRHPVVRHVLAEHRSGCGRTAIERVGPVLDADRPAEERVVRERDVAGREDLRIRSAQCRVGDDAVGDIEPGRRRQLHVRPDADASDDDVGRHLRTVGQHDGADVAVTAQLTHADAAFDRHTVGLVQRQEHARHLGPEHPLHGQRGHFDNGDRCTVRASGRRDLQSDPATTDDNHMRAVDETLRQVFAVGHGAQVEHTAQIGAGHVEPAGRRAGRQQQPVVRDTVAVGEHHGTVAPIDHLDGGAGPQLHVVCRVPVGVVHEGAVEAGRTQQMGLGQRRPLVWTDRFLADQHNPAIEALAAQRLGGLGAGEPGADDHELLSHDALPNGFWSASSDAGEVEKFRT